VHFLSRLLAVTDWDRSLFRPTGQATKHQIQTPKPGYSTIEYSYLSKSLVSYFKMESSQKAIEESKFDKGHRVGNFHNYYEFNPPDNRLIVLKQSRILSYLRSFVFDAEKIDQHRSKRLKTDQTRDSEDEHEQVYAYCDVGCNEGDLSLAMAKAFVKDKTTTEEDRSETQNHNLHILGLDIDNDLIERANQKKKKYSCENIISTFQTCNVNNDKDHMDQSRSFLKSIGKDRFDLISVFSTTMWIHIHGGDEGLIDFLKRICSLTNYLLIEPQPSKCYRSVNVRLRKMNRPEIDTSAERLKMRTDIENEIDRVLTSVKFERVDIDKELLMGKQTREHDSDTGSSMSTRTNWNRTLQLYKRITS